MQAAANRSAGIHRARRTDRLNATPHLGAVDDAGLLNALPIPAAILERTDDGKLRVADHNGRFTETVERSSCTALDWNEADCLRDGPIAELLQSFFEGKNTAGELDFKQGEGISSHFFRL